MFGDRQLFEEHFDSKISLREERVTTEDSTAKSKPRWQLKKSQMITVIVIGIILLGQALVISTEAGTTAHTVKVILGFIGAATIFFGIYARPEKEGKAKKAS